MTEGVTISPVNMKNRQEVDIQPGDTVRVWQKVEETGGKIRLQPFEGLVLARKHGSEAGATFTVRRTDDPYGTEKIFPLYSPIIDKIEILKRAKVRRAKLYHIRERAAKEIKRQMRNLRLMDVATTSDMEEKAMAAKESGEKADEVSDKARDDDATSGEEDTAGDNKDTVATEETGDEEKETDKKELEEKEKTE